MSVCSRVHHVLVDERTRCVVGTAALPEHQRIDACRLVLRVATADISSFETDIPWTAAADWPDIVRQAAEFLSSLREPSRGEDVLYRRTGEVPTDDEQAWEAFLTFAPYAYDASAWSAESEPIAALADAGESVVAALTPEQVSAVAHDIGWDALVPLKEWRTRHASSGHAPQ